MYARRETFIGATWVAHKVVEHQDVSDIQFLSDGIGPSTQTVYPDWPDPKSTAVALEGFATHADFRPRAWLIGFNRDRSPSKDCHSLFEAWWDEVTAHLAAPPPGVFDLPWPTSVGVAAVLSITFPLNRGHSSTSSSDAARPRSDRPLGWSERRRLSRLMAGDWQDEDGLRWGQFRCPDEALKQSLQHANTAPVGEDRGVYKTEVSRLLALFFNLEMFAFYASSSAVAGAMRLAWERTEAVTQGARTRYELVDVFGQYSFVVRNIRVHRPPAGVVRALEAALARWDSLEHQVGNPNAAGSDYFAGPFRQEWADYRRAVEHTLNRFREARAESPSDVGRGDSLGRKQT